MPQTKTTKYPLTFNDTFIGCEQFGFIKRRGDRCDDDDIAYERHMSSMTRKPVWVFEAVLYIYEE